MSLSKNKGMLTQSMSLSIDKPGPLDRGILFVFWTRWSDKRKGRLRKQYLDPDVYPGYVYNLCSAHRRKGLPEKADRLNKPTILRILAELRKLRPRAEFQNALFFFKMVEAVLCNDFSDYLVDGVVAGHSLPACYKSGMGVTQLELLEEHEIRMTINSLDIAYAKGGVAWQALLQRSDLDVAQARERREFLRQQKLSRRTEGFVITFADEAEAELINSR